MSYENLTPKGRTSLLEQIQKQRAGFSKKHEHIANFLLANPEVFIRQTSKKLCAELETSEPTVIRFCQSFGYSGLADFRIDLALALTTQTTGIFTVEPNIDDRRGVNYEAKCHIARCALTLLQDDKHIVIDNGSTAELFANELRAAEPLHIITSGLVIAQKILVHQKHRVTLTGGDIRPEALSLSGRLAEASIADMRFDTAYLSADSIDSQLGLSAFLEDEAYLTRAMVRSSRRVVVLADKSKFRQSRLHWICDLEQVDVLVTDAPLDAPELIPLRKANIHILSTQKEG